MTSNEDQGHSSQRLEESGWGQCTNVLPPIHFNRELDSVGNVAGEQVIVPQIPKDEPSQTSPVKSRSRKRKLTTTFASLGDQMSESVAQSNQGNLPHQPVCDSDMRKDSDLKLVLRCLRALAYNSQPQEEMMVVSQLQFGKYLGEPSYSATSDLLTHLNTVPEHFRQQHYDKGDFGVLIIHRQHGLFTLKIKSVEDNFSQLMMTEEQEDDVVMNKIKKAVKQLNKAEDVLKQLTSDLPDIKNITKILVMPNISSGQLQRALNRNTSTAEILCQCLGILSIDDAVKLCLLSDQLSDKGMSSDVNHIVLKDLSVWWQQVVRASGPQPLITSTVYEQLVVRFCGPATTMEVHCVTAPCLDIRIPEKALPEVGEQTTRLMLCPEHVEILNRSPPRVFVTGPPGTGKTIVLIMQGITWIHRGHDVHVVSTCYENREVTTFIEHRLQETMRRTTASSRVYRHELKFSFWNEGEVEAAVIRLKSLSEGRQLCVIADEAVYYYSLWSRKYFTDFCDQLIEQVPGVYLWCASARHEVRPPCLEEVKLTSLRSPPVIMEGIDAFQIEDWANFTKLFPVPTCHPEVIRFTHRDGQSGHTKIWPRDCVECGHQVARVLTELNVGQPGNSNGPPPLQYHDVLVLCLCYPTDDRVDSNGQMITTASGLVRGLRACHVPVRVVEKDDEAAIRDTALGVGDLVTVTHWGDVRGLERKVVVVENSGTDSSKGLFGIPCYRSQVVLIDWRPCWMF